MYSFFFKITSMGIEPLTPLFSSEPCQPASGIFSLTCTKNSMSLYVQHQILIPMVDLTWTPTQHMRLLCAAAAAMSMVMEDRFTSVVVVVLAREWFPMAVVLGVHCPLTLASILRGEEHMMAHVPLGECASAIDRGFCVLSTCLLCKVPRFLNL